MARTSGKVSAPPRRTFTLSTSARNSMTVASHRLGTSRLLTLKPAIDQLDARTATNARGSYHPFGLPVTRRPLDTESRHRWTTSPCLAFQRNNRLDIGMAAPRAEFRGWESWRKPVRSDVLCSYQMQRIGARSARPFLAQPEQPHPCSQ